ncbi:MAG: threonine/serine dehydratase [Actinomycetota bacterium]|nr:threonine/serine dehydratase [Actinomycetota bacterium]
MTDQPPIADDIEHAAERIHGRVRVTPIIDTGGADDLVDAPVVLKLELLQHTGSFKVRGAYNRVLSAGSPPLLVAASGGNHGLAVAYVAHRLGLRAEIFVPTTAPAVKIGGIRLLDADVTLVGTSYAEALAASLERAQRSGALMVPAYDCAEVVAGQGTVGRELEQQAPAVETILVATGGGGLIGGIAAWWSGRARIVSVEPYGAPTLHAALAAGEPVDVEVDSVAADSLGARRVGGPGFAAAVQAGVVPVLVSDDDIRRTRRLLWTRLRIAAEPGGATALAGLVSGVYRPEPGERVAVVVCGGNASPADL